MDFLVKDLMITILPSRPNFDDGCGNCSNVTDRCIGCSEGPSRGVVELFTPVINPASPQALAALKNQLHQVLAAVEAKEQVLLDSMRPKTMQEIEVLQKYMTAAIDELRGQAKEIEEQGRQGGGT